MVQPGARSDVDGKRARPAGLQAWLAIGDWSGLSDSQHAQGVERENEGQTTAAATRKEKWDEGRGRQARRGRLEQ